MDIELREHGPEHAVEDLSEIAVQKLSAVLKVSTAGTNRWMLKPGGKVGVIRIGELTVRIAPKVSTAHLLFLADYAKKAIPWGESLADMMESADLVASVADTYSRLTERALLGGALQAYRPVEQTLPVLKGKLRLADQLRARHGAAFPLDVSYQQFGIDTPENRLLKAATERALRLPRIRPETRRRLLWIGRQLSEVPPLEAGAVEGWRPTRLNVRYQAALGLADLILRGSSFDVPIGRIRAEGFILDMHVIFENFLCAAMDIALAQHVPGRAQYPNNRHLDQLDALPMKPDFLWLDDDRPRFVVDAKYKADGKNKPEDVYQMVAYCSALGLPAGHLVYVGEVDIPPVVHDVRVCGVRIVRHTLNLARPPNELLAAVDELARHIAAQSTVATGK